MKEVIVFEARSGMGMVPYKKDKHVRIFIDSPLQNIIDAARIAAKQTKKGKSVIAYGVIDGSLSYYEYNFPRTLFQFLKGKFSAEHIEDIKETFQLNEEVIYKKAGESFAYWWFIKNAPFEVILNPAYQEMLNRESKISKNIRNYFASNLVQYVKSIRTPPIATDSMLDGLIKELKKDFGEASLNIYHLRIARYLFYSTFGYLGGNPKNLQLTLGISPSQTIDEWSEIEKALDPVLMSSDPINAFKKLISTFGPIYEGYSSTKRNIVPLFMEIDGLFTSSTKANINRNYIEIKPSLPWPFSGKYKLYKDELKQLIREKKDHIAIKYPLIIPDHILQIFHILKEQTIKKTSTYIRELAERAMKEENIDSISILEGIAKSELKNVDRIWFVEGDGSRNEDGTLGIPRVNIMTGGAFEKALERISGALDAEYIRVISAPREDMESILSKPSSRGSIVLGYKRLIQETIKTNLIINGEWTSF